MKSIYKLTPWILLAAIIIVLVISFFMNKSSGHIEGFESRIKLENYYDNKIELTKLHDNIHFDEINGSLVFVNESSIDVLNRDGTTTMPENHKDTMENLVEPRKFTHNIQSNSVCPTSVSDAVPADIDLGTWDNALSDAENKEKQRKICEGAGMCFNSEWDGAWCVKPMSGSGELKYTIFYSAIGKHTNIYIFGYTNTSDNDGNTTQQVALIGSYAFAIDNGNCTPEGNGSGTCNQKSDSCSSGIGYYDNTSETHKCCSCTPEFAGEDMTFTTEEGKVEGLTPVEQTTKAGSTSGNARITKYDTDIALERIISNAVLFDKKMGNLVLIDSHENDGNATEPTIINHKNENIKNTEELTKAENLISLFTIHKNMLILYSLYSNNVNLTVVQLVNQAEGSPKLELISSNHYLIETPNSTSSTTSSMGSSTTNTTSNSSSSNPAQDMGDTIYNRVSRKIGDVIEHELDKLLNPDASTDDRYILKTQVVPPVCPTCPNCVNNCKEGGVCSDCGGNGGSGTKTENGDSLTDKKESSATSSSTGNPVSDVIGETGNVAEQTVGAAGDLVTTTATATGDLVKTTAGTAVDVADSTVGGVARDLYSGTKGVAGDVYGATKGVAGDIYGTATGIVGDLYGGAKSLTSDVYGGIKSLGPNGRGQLPSQVPQGVTPSGSNIGVTQRTAYTNTGNQPSNVYNYYGALPNKETRYVPLTTDFSAFGR